MYATDQPSISGALLSCAIIAWWPSSQASLAGQRSAAASHMSRRSANSWLLSASGYSCRGRRTTEPVSVLNVGRAITEAGLQTVCVCLCDSWMQSQSSLAQGCIPTIAAVHTCSNSQQMLASIWSWHALAAILRKGVPALASYLHQLLHQWHRSSVTQQLCCWMPDALDGGDNTRHLC